MYLKMQTLKETAAMYHLKIVTQHEMAPDKLYINPLILYSVSLPHNISFFTCERDTFK